LKAMILAAGRGVRMRPLTDALPKPLLPVRGKALLVWTIERLARAGLRELVINHSHLGAMIESRIGDGSAFGVSIRYSRESEPLETAGGIANALALLGTEPFVVANGDILCDFDFARLRRLALSPGHLAHLVLVPNPPHNAQGDFVLEDPAVRAEGLPRHTFSGIALYRPELFSGVRPGDKAKLAPLLRCAMEQGRVSGELHAGEWHDVGTPERLAELDAGP
jgi:MurNAc alpha-1-phosphate uridylyltransferase